MAKELMGVIENLVEAIQYLSMKVSSLDPGADMTPIENCLDRVLNATISYDESK